MPKKIIYNRPIILSIGGFDPSGGAGISADIKTFEQHNVIGLSVATCITIQNENEFKKVYWLSFKQIKEQIQVLLKSYSIKIIKIGLIKDFKMLNNIISLLKKNIPECKIIFDPILKATAGFSFHKKIALEKIIDNFFLLTPNWLEAKTLFNTDNPVLFFKEHQLNCNLLLKGGHSDNERFATDILFSKKGENIFKSKRLKNIEKHGSGCVLSSSIAANLGLGMNLEKSCENAKKYVFNFLSSNNNRLGYHT